MVPPPKLARLLATEPLLAAALEAPGSAVNLQCANQSCWLLCITAKLWGMWCKSECHA